MTFHWRADSGPQRVLTGFGEHQTVLVYSLIRVFVFNIQASLYVIAHKITRQLNRDSRWDIKCIDQHVHMRMLIKVLTFRR